MEGDGGESSEQSLVITYTEEGDGQDNDKVPDPVPENVQPIREEGEESPFPRRRGFIRRGFGGHLVEDDDDEEEEFERFGVGGNRSRWGGGGGRLRGERLGDGGELRDFGGDRKIPYHLEGLSLSPRRSPPKKKLVKKFYVKMEGFGVNWEGNFRHLMLTPHDFREVTLGCRGAKDDKDIELFKGDKKVMVKRSGFCERIFKTLDFIDAHLIFVFKKIRARTMGQLMNFLYTGKITVNRDTELDDFMEAANLLEVTCLRPVVEYSSMVPEDKEEPDLEGEEESSLQKDGYLDLIKTSYNLNRERQEEEEEEERRTVEAEVTANGGPARRERRILETYRNRASTSSRRNPAVISVRRREVGEAEEEDGGVGGMEGEDEEESEEEEEEEEDEVDGEDDRRPGDGGYFGDNFYESMGGNEEVEVEGELEGEEERIEEEDEREDDKVWEKLDEIVDTPTSLKRNDNEEEGEGNGGGANENGN